MQEVIVVDEEITEIPAKERVKVQDGYVAVAIVNSTGELLFAPSEYSDCTFAFIPAHTFGQ